MEHKIFLQKMWHATPASFEKYIEIEDNFFRARVMGPCGKYIEIEDNYLLSQVH